MSLSILAKTYHSSAFVGVARVAAVRGDAGEGTAAAGECSDECEG